MHVFSRQKIFETMFERELVKILLKNKTENNVIRYEDNIRDMMKDTRQLKTFYTEISTMWVN